MEYLIDGPKNAARTFVFAHGAGAPMDTPFMNAIARGLAARSIRVLRFEFPYMAKRRTGAKRGAPDRQPVLLDTFRAAAADAGPAATLILGGKSMGGRMATMVADELGVSGLVCFGYPFHPPGAPEKLRTEHLRSLKTPALIVQGERDQFGSRQEVADYDLSDSIEFLWIEDGDHSLKPKGGAAKAAAALEQAIDRASSFIAGRGR